MKKIISALMLLIVSMGMSTSFLQAEEFLESAVLCQSRANPKKKWAAFVESCSEQEQKEACGANEGVATALFCKTYTSEPEIQKLYDDNEMTVLVECMTETGIGFRAITGDKSPEAAKEICDPKMGLRVTGVKDFGTDKAGLAKAKNVNINRAFTKCRLAIPGVPAKDLELPGRDCTPETQKIVCAQAQAVPIECNIRKDFGRKK